MSSINDFIFTRIENGYQIGNQTDIDWNGIAVDPEKVFVINIPKYYKNAKVVELGKHCFSSLPYLKTLLIPNTIQCFRRNAIWNCTKLVSVDFEENSNFQLAERGAFDRCESLVAVFLPPSLKTLGNFSFCRCFSLKTIVYCGTYGFDSSILYGAWGDLNHNVTIYVRSEYPLDEFITKPVIKDDSLFENAHFFYKTQTITPKLKSYFFNFNIFLLIVFINNHI